MFLLLAMIQALGGAPIQPPPPPRPTPEQVQAAKALFSTDPWHRINRSGVSLAAAQIGLEALQARKLYTRDREFALFDRLEKLARERQTEIIDAAVTCASMRYDGLWLGDLKALKAFITSPEGERFWRTNEDLMNWQACFKAPTQRVLAPALDAEIAAVVKQLPKGEP